MKRTRSILKNNSLHRKETGKEKVGMFFNANQAESEEAIVA